MPNQTLTIVSENPSKNGYEWVDDKGQTWWTPPRDKKSEESNEPLAVEIRANFGKPLELATWIKDDNTTHAIFGKAKQSGGGGKRPESWGYSEAGTRYREETSNRRTALMCAKEIGERFDMAGPAVLDLANQYWEWLQAPFQSVGGGGTAAGVANSVPPTSAEGESAGDKASDATASPPPADDFQFRAGPYEGKMCSEIARTDPEGLRERISAGALSFDKLEIAEKLLGVA